MGGKFTLGKQERLKSRKAIEQVFGEGRKFMSGPYRVSWLDKPTEGQLSIRFGVGVSTRHFPRAVDRNRIKRLTREAFRLQKPAFLEKLEARKIDLYLFFVYTGKEIPTYEQTAQAVSVLIKKLAKQVLG